MIERYLIVAALGADRLRRPSRSAAGRCSRAGAPRTAWMALAALADAAAASPTPALNLNLRRFENELTFRGDAHDGADARCSTTPRVTAALRCGPLTLPNHKLVPDARWIARPALRAGARARRGGVQAASGPRPATGRRAGLRDEPLRDLQARLHGRVATRRSIQVPPDGWTPRRARREHYAAYVRGC